MKISLEQRKEIQDLISSGISKTEIANKYNLNLATVYRILNKKLSKCQNCNKEYFKTNRTMLWCSDECRFWSHVDINVQNINACWPWTGNFKTDKGYGRFPLTSRKSTTAPRFAYQDYHKTTIPNKLEIRHKCDNPSCCNPHHLELGTRKENMQDASKRNRIKNNPQKHHSKENLTQKDIEDIRNTYTKGDPNFSLKTLAKRYDVHFTTISKIVNKVGFWSYGLD